MKSNFVVFSQSRSGSSLFCENLNYQKDIACMKEIFRKNYFKNADARNQLQEFFININFNFIEDIRCKNFEKFLILMSEISNKPIFGYKITEPQAYRVAPSKKIYLNYLKNNKSKIILLTRDNLLLKYISHQTAHEIGFDSRIQCYKYEAIHQLNPIKINYYEYKKYVNQVNFFLQERKEEILSYNLPHIHIKYEDLFEGKYLESMAIVYEFLNLDFKRFEDVRQTDGIIAGHKKINVYPIRDKVINYEEFKKLAQDNNDIETLKFLQ